MTERSWPFVVAVAMTWCHGTAAEPMWVSLGGPPGSGPGVVVVSEREDETVLEISIPGFWLADTVMNGAAYSWVVLPGEACIEKFEYPALPKVSRSIIIPDMARMALEVTEDETEEMIIPPVLPSRGIIMRSEDPDTIPFRFSKLYEEGGVFPAMAAGLGTPYVFRDFRGIAVHAHPFSHDPRTGRLLIRKRMIVRAYEAGIDTVNVKLSPRSGRADPGMIAGYRAHFVNYAAGGSRYDLLPETGEMLVIAGDGFSQAPGSPLRRFVDWKQRRGHRVHLFTSSEAGGSWEQIQDFIREKWTSEIPALCFVVLVGDGAWDPAPPYCVAAPWDDVAELPPVNHPADNQYAYLDGSDHYADLLLSRFPAGSESELDRQVSGLIQYERNPPFEPGPLPWLTGITAIASWECDGPPFNQPGGPHHCNGDPDWVWAQRTMSDFESYYFLNNGDYWIPDPYYYRDTDPTCPVTPEGVATRVNEGRSWLTVIGHGTPNGWLFHNALPGAPPTYAVFGTNHIGLLQNYGRLPFVFSVACQVANWIQAQPSFAKAWMCAGSPANPAGAVGFLGATTDISWTPPLFALVEAVKVMLGQSPNSPPAGTIGAAYFAGLAHMLDQFTWLETYSEPRHRIRYLHTPQCWAIHGDCSMQVRTLPPAPIAVTHPTHIGHYGLASIAVPFEIGGIGADDHVSVTLVLEHGGEEDLVARTLQTGPGSGNLLISPAPQEDGTLWLTASGLNKIPYEGAIVYCTDYRGVQQGIQRARGSFRVNGDIAVEPDHELTLTGSPGCTWFYVDNSGAFGHTNYGTEPSLCEFVVPLAARLILGDVWIGCNPGISGHWGGIVATDAGAEIELSACTVAGAREAVRFSNSGMLSLSGCTIAGCANAGVQWSGGTAQATVAGSSFQGCEWGIQINGCSGGSDIQVSGCTFSDYWRGVEMASVGTLDVKDWCTFTSSRPGVDIGVAFSGGCSGSVIGCTFGWLDAPGGDQLYHGVDCRSGNSLVTVSNNCFNGPGGFNCMIALDNSGIFALGQPVNCPRIRSNSIQNQWYGGSVKAGSLADLGHDVWGEYGRNEFSENCCHLQYEGKATTPPGGTLYAERNCWDWSANPSGLCGSWSWAIDASPGDCSQGDGAPALVPEVYAVRVVGPNPFSDVAELELALPEDQSAGLVAIEIVDLAGRALRKLVVQNPRAGSHRLQWDGRDGNGALAPSGTYVARTRIGPHMLSDTVVFLRTPGVYR
ncbi:right-handed parallel beta-helix repeat-containing protein [Candidatus Fermentibacteria bacterium]|nr:right-handed parallel beta-helix repeat-containing protein [Candidatus Fermentibacteria bacterium]